MRRLVFAATLAASVVISTAAGASTTLVKQNSDLFGGGGHAHVSDIANRPHITADAGGFRLKDGATNLVAWCLDVFDDLALPGLYTITTTPFSNHDTLTGTQLSNIQKLFDVNYSDAMLADNNKSAGFQMALWELIYEKASNLFNVSSGNWHADSTNGAEYWANVFLGDLDDSTSQHFNLTFYQGEKNGRYGYGQNLVSATPVPLPAAAGLLVFGLLGLYGMTGRRRLADAS
jgi:hypothetical protein